SALLLGLHIARLVHDRHGTVARILHHLAADNVNHRRTLVVAVPGHDAPGREIELAQAEEAALQRHRTGGEVGTCANDIGHALGAVAHHRLALAVGYALVRRALARQR